MQTLLHYKDWVKFGKKSYIVKFYAGATGVEICLFFTLKICPYRYHFTYTETSTEL